jgi:CBS domain containing-hemolysin-like protein
VQRDILRRYSSLAETEVVEVMVPRVDIVGIERSTPWSEAVDRVRSSRHARLPVYDDTLDQVTGILFAKDILRAVIEGVEPASDWRSVVRPASFIPEGKSAEAQLRDFRSTHQHLAIVVDEYGGTAGLVTIEDILEEIVGEISDENDEPEAPIQSEDGARYWVSGRVTLEELSDAIGHRFVQEDVTTVGGLVFHHFGKVPRAGDRTVIDGFPFTVERVVRRRVDRVFVERPELEADGEERP